MTDSYISSLTGDLSSPKTNGSALNGSSPSLSNNLHSITPIIRKKLMGYVGFANLPNQVHRKSVRKGFQFTVMVVGASHQKWAFAPRSSHPLILPRRVGFGQVDFD
jgi:septin 7